MSNLSSKYLFFLFISLLLSGTGCRSKREIVSGSELSRGALPENIPVLEHDSRDFRTLKLRKADLELVAGDVREKVRGNIAIYNDSLIAVSIIPLLGYEAFRILCTRDSVILINRMEKSYMINSYEFFRMKYDIPLAFKDLIALLSNRAFFYTGQFKEKDLTRKFGRLENGYMINMDSYVQGRHIIKQRFRVDPSGAILEGILISDYERKMKFSVDYTEFQADNNLVFPRKMSVDFQSINTAIEMVANYGQVVLNDSIRVKFAVPENYKPGSF
jgi:hypothetical protein